MTSRYVSQGEVQRMVAEVKAKFPAEFGLRAWPNKRFQISTSASYWNGAQLVLYTEIWDEVIRAWKSFCKGTEYELQREMVHLKGDEPGLKPEPKSGAETRVVKRCYRIVGWETQFIRQEKDEHGNWRDVEWKDGDEWCGLESKGDFEYNHEETVWAKIYDPQTGTETDPDPNDRAATHGDIEEGDSE